MEINKNIKILHVNTVDSGSGAAIACRRLHTALLNSGYKSQMLVLKRSEPDNNILEVSSKSYWLGLIKQKMASLLLTFQKSNNPISHSLGLFSTNAIKVINKSDADIIHLHWINGEMLSISDIKKIKKKVIWTLHDSWAFCGTEHHPDILNNDVRYREGYTKENKLVGAKGIDINRLIWNYKRKQWRNLDCFFTAPSKWEQDMFQSSKLLGNLPCQIIPNIIDTSIFKPIDKKIARKIFGVKANKKIFIFGSAMDPMKDKNKGFDIFLEVLNKLANFVTPDSLNIIVFGTKNQIFPSDFPFSYECIGSLKDEIAMSILYNCADILLAPSRVESFGYTAIESISCGTPVVSFNTSGLRDIIVHKKNGYLAKCFDVDDYVNGIVYLLEHHEVGMINECRKSVLERFSMDKTLLKYTSLYKTQLVKS